MTAPAQPATAQAPPQTSQADRQVIAGIAAVLASSAAAGLMAATVARLLKPLQISPEAARGAFIVTMRVTRRQGRRVGGPAERVTATGQDAYRAAYILAAARRINERLSAAGSDSDARRAALADALKAEARYAAQQQQAQDNRLSAAQAVDQAAARVGKTAPGGAKLLGWHAVMDARTSAECADANGRNFPADRPPLIGWPGAVHPHCRCKPGKPFAGARLVDDIGAGRKAA